MRTRILESSLARAGRKLAASHEACVNGDDLKDVVVTALFELELCKAVLMKFILDEEVGT